MMRNKHSEMAQRKTHASKPRFRLPLSAYLTYLLLLTLLFTGVTFSGYISTTNGSDTARVASFVVDTVGSGDAALEVDCNETTDTASYQFSVTNTKDSNTSEVAMEYDVVVTMAQALPTGISVSLADASGSAVTRTDTGTTVFTFANAGRFAAGSAETDIFTLTFTSTKGALTSAVEANAITIEVNARQMD